MRALETPRPSQRIRVALLYDGAWRPLLWLRVGKDGSIYLGALLGQPTHGLKFEKTGVGEQPVTLRYAEGGAVTARDVKKGSRVSFKVSGEIHIGESVVMGTPLKDLSDPRQLCVVLFVHPSRYRPPVKQAPDDYDFAIVGYPVDDGCPMCAAVYIAPWDGRQIGPPPPLEEMKVWASFAWGFCNLTRTPDYALGVVIGHGSAGMWPPLPGIAVLAKV